MIRVIYLLVIVLLGFQNCGEDVGFSQGSQVASADGPPPAINDDLNGSQDNDYGVIDSSCENGDLITTTINVQFPKPAQECAWEEMGNLSRVNAYFRARIKQTKNLGLPYGAVICDASFDFKQQEYRYDDYFAFLFNDMVISSGYDFTGFLPEGNFELQAYKWDDIVGIPMNFGSAREQVYCPQISQGNITCDFPGHDTPGNIDFDMDKRYVRAIMSNGVPANHNFSLVTFGDNNDFDCEHSDVEFDVTVSYILTE